MSAAHISPKHACRIIRTLIKKTPGVALPLPVNVCEVHVRLRKPIRSMRVFWPMLTIEDWVQTLLDRRPELLLAGNSKGGNWQATFSSFWKKYHKLNPSHPVFSECYDLAGAIPALIHGDEGRGHIKRPYMVISWQCLLGLHGPDMVNDTSSIGYAFDFKLLHPMKLLLKFHIDIPRLYMYPKHVFGTEACTMHPISIYRDFISPLPRGGLDHWRSYDRVHKASLGCLSQRILRFLDCFCFMEHIFLSRPPLVHSHILVTRAFVQDIDGTRIRLVWIGCKGDWPFLRKELLLRLVLSVSLVPQQWNKCDSQPFLSGPNCCQPRHSILAPALLQSASAIDALLRTTNCKNTYRTVPRFNLNSSNGFDVVKLSCGWDSFWLTIFQFVFIQSPWRNGRTPQRMQLGGQVAVVPRHSRASHHCCIYLAAMRPNMSCWTFSIYFIWVMAETVQHQR